MLDRTDRSLVGIWWWTVDKWLYQQSTTRCQQANDRYDQA